MRRSQWKSVRYAIWKSAATRCFKKSRVKELKHAQDRAVFEVVLLRKVSSLSKMHPKETQGMASVETDAAGHANVEVLDVKQARRRCAV